MKPSQMLYLIYHESNIISKSKDFKLYYTTIVFGYENKVGLYGISSFSVKDKIRKIYKIKWKN